MDAICLSLLGGSSLKEPRKRNNSSNTNHRYELKCTLKLKHLHFAMLTSYIDAKLKEGPSPPKTYKETGIQDLTEVYFHQQ